MPEFLKKRLQHPKIIYINKIHNNGMQLEKKLIITLKFKIKMKRFFYFKQSIEVINYFFIFNLLLLKLILNIK